MTAAVFGPTLVVALIFVVLVVGLPAWAVVDMILRRSGDFSVTGLNKATWLGLTVGLGVAAWTISLMSVVLAGFVLNYLVRVRPGMRSQRER